MKKYNQIISPDLVEYYIRATVMKVNTIFWDEFIEISIRSKSKGSQLELYADFHQGSTIPVFQVPSIHKVNSLDKLMELHKDIIEYISHQISKICKVHPNTLQRLSTIQLDSYPKLSRVIKIKTLLNGC
jgi:hypothetical protein